MTKNEKSAGAIVYYYEEKPYFLLLKYKNYWGFAKGLIEQGESAEETAKREVMEETGLKDIQIIPKFEFKQQWFYKREGELVRKEAIFLLARITKQETGNTRISHEHEDFCWLPYEEAIKLMKIKQNKAMLEKAYEFIKEHESQKRLV
jgi:tRNA nucleotidyltransferase (CCA-adding enzyme)